MTTRKVIAAIVDTKQLTLYHPDDTTTVILQGDSRLPDLVRFVTPICSAPGAVAEVPEEMFEYKHVKEFRNTYSEFEERSNGFVRFFRVAKAKLAKAFGMGQLETPTPVVEEVEHYPATVIGNVPGTPAAVEKVQSAVEEIMANAIPSNQPGFHSNEDENEDSETTIVAVVGDQAIGGAEGLRGQLMHANQTGQDDGPTKLIERMLKMGGQRNHSATELMNFLKRGDLPVDNNGDIIIFKVLRRHPEKKGRYLDCHSRSVDQGIGSLVQMDEKLVNPSRREQCSTGLHVARRGYVRGFGGDVCVIAKLRPESVIAVPSYDADKMRVCAYHIVHELSQKQYDLLKNDRPITDDPDGKIVLANIMAGNHIGIIEDVVIGGPMGTNVTVTPRAQVVKAVLPTGPVKPVDSIDLDKVDNKVEIKGPSVNPLNVSRETTDLKANQAQPTAFDGQGPLPGANIHGIGPMTDGGDNPNYKPDTQPEAPQTPVQADPVAVDASPRMASEARQREARKLYDAWRDATSEKGRKNALQKLKDFKSKARISWESLGIENPATVVLPPIAKVSKPEPERATTKSPSMTAPYGRQTGKTAIAQAVTKPVPPPKPDPFGTPPGFKPAAKIPAAGQTVSKGKTLAQQAREFVVAKNAAGLQKFKKDRKKSWDALGITADELKTLGITK